MGDQLDILRDEVLRAVEGAGNLQTLDEVRVQALGKKGRLTEVMRTLGTMPPEERRAFGQRANVVKEALESSLAERRQTLEAAELDHRLVAEGIDVTLPPRPQPMGRLHPVTQVTEEITAIFADMGFAVAEGPDIDRVEIVA